MKLALLTTDTVHHCYFLDELNRRHRVAAVLSERARAAPAFQTAHPYEVDRDEHERQAWFGGRDIHLADLFEVSEYRSLNDAEAVATLRSLRPDVVIVFGTGRLTPAVIETCPRGIVNLHGGDPERHRGLDSHLWAIHQGRFDALTTTLHRVNPRLDDGEIVDRAGVPLHRDMPLHELRRHNTELCVELTAGALDGWLERGAFRSQPQRHRGEYFSHMPAPLKGACRARFQEFTRSLAR